MGKKSRKEICCSGFEIVIVNNVYADQSADSEIAKKFSRFLERINLNIDVFCSSVSGTINQGDDFVKAIEDGLKNSDVFIPLISKNYHKRYESRRIKASV